MDTPDYQDRAAYRMAEFYRAYGVCRTTAYAEIKRGKLRAVKIGRRTLILRSDAEAWARSLPTVGRVQ